VRKYWRSLHAKICWHSHNSAASVNSVMRDELQLK
jgi:hypothetical protein